MLRFDARYLLSVLLLVLLGLAGCGAKGPDEAQLKAWGDRLNSANETITAVEVLEVGPPTKIKLIVPDGTTQDQGSLLGNDLRTSWLAEFGSDPSPDFDMEVVTNAGQKLALHTNHN